MRTIRHLALPFAATFTLLAVTGGCSSDPQGGAGGGQGGAASSSTTGSGAGGGQGGQAPLGAPFAKVVVVDQSGAADARSDVLVTFGQPFAPGDVPPGATVAARAGGVDVPLQVDAKATHADGSLRHAVLTARIPTLPGGGSVPLELYATKAGLSGDAVAATDLLAAGFDTKVTVTLGGETYEASARDLLQKGNAKTWLSGPLVAEWAVAAPLTSTNAGPHSHLTARFDVRALAGAHSARVSVTVENDWTYEPNPQSFTYDATIATDKDTVYTQTGLVHYRQARWRQVFWWGDDPKVDVQHDVQYLLSSGSVPHFDPALVPPEKALADLDTTYTAKAYQPMGIGLAMAYMPTTGGRPDIGPLPKWGALYLLSQDARAKRATLGTADGGGSWSMHYRDKTTDLPVSLIDHPYMTLVGTPGDAINPMTKKSDAFPPCGGDCKTPYTNDSAHQPSLAYLPYLLTGDRFYLEELQFWANYNMLLSNPYYREFEQGLFKSDQVRGQGWSMRTLGQVAYITPDANPMKKYFVDRVHYNIDWYSKTYVQDPQANELGYLGNGYAIGADGTTAPWMDDFFTWSVGFLVELGFDDAAPLLAWKSKFQVGRMIDPGYCWIFASIYHLAVKDTNAGTLYHTFKDAYEASLKQQNQEALLSMECGGADMAAALSLKPGEMVGYSSSATGFPSNFQPALAVAVESGIPGAKEAWDKFMARSVKPDYSVEPQFAVVPRE